MSIFSYLNRVSFCVTRMTFSNAMAHADVLRVPGRFHFRRIWGITPYMLKTRMNSQTGKTQLLQKFKLKDGGRTFSVDVESFDDVKITCHRKDARKIYRVLRTAFKRTRKNKRQEAMPILPRDTHDKLQAYVFDFFRAVQGLGSAKGLGNVGVLFSGPPGVGKSETMRWIVERGKQEFQRSCYRLGFSELRKMLADGQPLNSDSTIILIDDIDADLLRDRKETKNPLTSQFLTCLDGLDKSEGRLVIISTNEKINDGIDPALTRPGRLDHVVTFDYPTQDLVEEFCVSRKVDLNPHLFEGWSFARIDMFLAKARASEFLYNTPIAAYYEQFVHDMGEHDDTVDTYQTEEEYTL